MVVVLVSKPHLFLNGFDLLFKQLFESHLLFLDSSDIPGRRSSVRHGVLQPINGRAALSDVLLDSLQFVHHRVEVVEALICFRT